MRVLVTGATGGLGSAVAEAFAADGADLALIGREGDRLDAVAAAVGEAGGHVTTATADVRDEDAVFEALAEVGSVDVLVHCVGIIDDAPGETPLTATEYTTFDEVLETNTRGLFAVLREGVQFLPADGRVLVPTGRVAREPHEGMGAYGVSKAADEGIVRGFAADAEQTVGLVEPGLVATDLTGGRGKDPGRVAGLFVWAATDCPAADLDGQVVDVRAWRQATR